MRKIHLVKMVDGKSFSSSVRELREEFPHISFPSDLSCVDLSPYGYALSETSASKDATVHPAPTRVAMHQFLYAVREFGFREQFERYTLALDGHARDYWFTAPYVNKDHVCVKHMAKFFQLSTTDLHTIFSIAGSIEE
jgi:hypothetical protein